MKIFMEYTIGTYLGQHRCSRFLNNIQHCWVKQALIHNNIMSASIRITAQMKLYTVHCKNVYTKVRVLLCHWKTACSTLSTMTSAKISTSSQQNCLLWLFASLKCTYLTQSVVWYLSLCISECTWCTFYTQTVSTDLLTVKSNDTCAHHFAEYSELSPCNFHVNNENIEQYEYR